MVKEDDHWRGKRQICVDVWDEVRSSPSPRRCDELFGGGADVQNRYLNAGVESELRGHFADSAVENAGRFLVDSSFCSMELLVAKHA